MPQIDGFLNLLKPPGMTSHDAVARIRRIFSTRSVGHAGTLDPAASGVLPMAIGKATRLLEYMVGTSKTYIGEATFGIETDTLDQCGQVVAKLPANFSQAELEAEMAELVGHQLQSPPAFSAVKHLGKPLYEYARQGEIIQKPGRKIEIAEFRLLSHSPGRFPRCLFHLNCSKGTYVRVLVKDLAQRLQTTATLSFLLRASVGSLTVQDAFTLEELMGEQSINDLVACLMPMDTAVSHLAAVALSADEAVNFVNGQLVSVSQDITGLCRVCNADRLIGMGEAKNGLLQPRKVLTSREDIC